MNWQDVSQLRKAGQLDEARNMVLEILKSDPDDFRARTQYEWVIFGYIKRLVATMSQALKNSDRIDDRDVDELMSLMRAYANLEPSRPDLACSKILAYITEVGHQLPKFPEIIRWVGIDGLREEDWLPREYEGKKYSSLAMGIARALCKWAHGHPDASEEQMKFALEWAQRVKETTSDDDALWLNWDMAMLLRQMGEFQHAAELLTGVIKAKRNESWVWAEAGRLYLSEQPDLALACFCRALECPAEPKYLVRAHRELAELLAEQEEYAQASSEIATIIGIRQREGWSVGRELEALISRPWYDPSADGAEEPKAYYAKHSPAALALCFDVIETSAANYLGVLKLGAPKDPRPGHKPKTLIRFAVKDEEGRTWSLVGPRIKNLSLDVGAPVNVVIGRQDGDDRQSIVHVSVRPEGANWDCLEAGVGVVMLEATAEKPTKVFVAGSGEELSVAEGPGEPLCIGDGVRFGFARNPKDSRAEAFNVERGELPEVDVKLIRGQLRRNPKGFGFVEDAFVAPPIVESVSLDVLDVEALAVFRRHPTKSERSWRVIKMSAV